MSTIVQLQEMEPCIFQMTMQDRESKNTFSQALVEGLVSNFQEIKQSDRCKVVILTCPPQIFI